MVALSESLTTEDIREAWKTRKQQNLTAFARELGLPRSTVWDAIHKGGSVPKVESVPSSSSERSYEESGDKANMKYTTERPVRTLEDALRFAEVDTSVWRVKKWGVTSWEVGMKMRSFDQKGHVTGETPRKEHLWRVNVDLERILPKPFLDATDAIFERLGKRAPEYRVQPVRALADPHMLEVDLFDAHFGKLAWAPETGQNYDLKIAEAMFANAVEDLLARAKGYTVEKILFPIGNDFFHIDGLTQATTAGTLQDTDGRYAKIIETGEMAVIRAIERCLEVAPVEVVWVPGNHDRVASFHLSRTVAAWFRNTPFVTVDRSPSPRKYVRYGVGLLGFTHGNEEKHASLPAIMATEVPDLWAATKSREWHLGHRHQAKRVDSTGVGTHDGVVVRILRSLSATDAWHFSRGYLSTNRAAEAYLWSLYDGYTGHFVAHARDN